MTDADLPDFPNLEARVRYGMTIEPYEREQAASRSKANPYVGPARRGCANAVVAHRIGMSEVAYFRARAIVRAADDTSLPDDVRKVAIYELAMMNETNTFSGPYERLRAAMGPAGQGRPKIRPRRHPRSSEDTRRGRRPVLERIEEAVYEIGRNTASLANTLADDRWPAQRDKLGPATIDDLRRLSAKLTQIISQLTEGKPTP